MSTSRNANGPFCAPIRFVTYPSKMLLHFNFILWMNMDSAVKSKKHRVLIQAVSENLRAAPESLSGCHPSPSTTRQRLQETHHHTTLTNDRDVPLQISALRSIPSSQKMSMMMQYLISTYAGHCPCPPLSPDDAATELSGVTLINAGLDQSRRSAESYSRARFPKICQMRLRGCLQC
jgi:hypothetical protein